MGRCGRENSRFTPQKCCETEYRDRLEFDENTKFCGMVSLWESPYDLSSEVARGRSPLVLRKSRKVGFRIPLILEIPTDYTFWSRSRFNCRKIGRQDSPDRQFCIKVNRNLTEIDKKSIDFKGSLSVVSRHNIRE